MAEKLDIEVTLCFSEDEVPQEVAEQELKLITTFLPEIMKDLLIRIEMNKED